MFVVLIRLGIFKIPVINRVLLIFGPVINIYIANCYKKNHILYCRLGVQRKHRFSEQFHEDITNLVSAITADIIGKLINVSNKIGGGGRF